MRTYDFSPFWRSTIGFDRLLDLVETAQRAGEDNYPPYNIERLGDDRLYLVPSREQTDLQLFGSAPVSELAPIGEVPLSGYSRTGLEVVPGWAYLFRTVAADGYYRFGALRVLYAGTDFILIDWAFQTDPGNPMLIRESP